jgi:dCMP deaminase
MNHKTRPSIGSVCMSIAEAWSQRSTCVRQQIGAVIASRDGHILSTGYNGAPRGVSHCTEVGCLKVDGHCQRAIHAEANAILQAARLGTTLRESVLITTHRPCIVCAKLLVQVGVQWILYKKPYDSDGLRDEVMDFLLDVHILVTTDINDRRLPWQQIFPK